jgi:hypothetical protein
MVELELKETAGFPAGGGGGCWAESEQVRSPRATIPKIRANGAEKRSLIEAPFQWCGRTGQYL